MRLIDSHCHLDFEDFAGHHNDLLTEMRAADVVAAVCIGVSIEAFPAVLDLAERFPAIFATVGVHPDYQDCVEPSVDDLRRLASAEKVIAIGETGLDYYRLTGDLAWQRTRFRTHIQAARAVGKPLIVHTRAAAEDTLRVLREEGADACGGIMHCFTEDWSVAKAALDLGFHLSFSGIVSFKTADSIREVARKTPLDRVLVETDAPYLAPVPYRGKTNRPAYVRHVAAAVAAARGVPLEEIADATTENFCALFPSTRAIIEAVHAP